MTDPQCPGAQPPSEQTLVAAGWERRFTADPIRAKEATALYASLGFEVRTEPLRSAEFGPQCQECQLVACRTYVTIYTRRER